MKSNPKTKHQRLLQTNCHIGIVGSGLGGLSAALAILQCDLCCCTKKQKRKSAKLSGGGEHDCKSSSNSNFQGRITIYERDHQLSDRKEGYGMTLTYNPSGPLAHLGILESVARRDCPSRSHYLFNEKGEVMGYYGNAFHSVSDENTDENLAVSRGVGQRGNLRIPRGELRSILLEKIEDTDQKNTPSKVNIAWGKRLISYVDRPAIERLNKIGKNAHDFQSEPSMGSDQRNVFLQFEDGTTDEVDLLIGADGVNSVVARQYMTSSIPSKSDQKSDVTRSMTPEYIGIFIIIGISNHMHPLIDERGYYTLDGNHRLFIMPFSGNSLEEEPRRTMWQLSYPVSDREEANRLSQIGPLGLQKEVLRRCCDWHEPFPDMVKSTPLNTIWGTGLLDRNPECFIRHRQELEVHGRTPSHVVLLGDAAHAMSPFKGSGANQALADGPLLAKWLSQSKFHSAVRGYMTEMTRRSSVKVKASREAALKLHSNLCWKWMASQDGVASAIFHGVPSDGVKSLLDTLKKQHIGASLGASLDDSIRGIIKKLDVFDATKSRDTTKTNNVLEDLRRLQSQALEYVASGNLEHLRQLSQKSQFVIAKALDSNKRTCLHIAASNGYLEMCRWLLSEANIDPKLRDDKNQTAIDIANERGQDKVAQIIQSWMKRCRSPEREQESITNGGDESLAERDVYRKIEQQLRPIKTMRQLGVLLKKNREKASNEDLITQVLGFTSESEDGDEQRKWEQSLAREHGAVLLRNYVSREIDQLAIGSMALRPLNLDVPNEIMELDFSKKRLDKQIEDLKSQIVIPANSPIIVQTNFGPQLASQTPGNATKKRKAESFSISRIRYLNLGEWNYNWGDRRYDKVSTAMPFPASFSSLADRAYQLAKQRCCQENELGPGCSNVSFDMAICNFYHLQRPSDRLGGHKDDVESDLTSPLVTISLGAPGIFLLGRESRSCKPTAILLRSGDCIVMSGKSRRYFHGVPTILEFKNDCDNSNVRTVFPELEESVLNNRGSFAENYCKRSENDIPSNKELWFMKAFLRTARMNISIRHI